jgi:hypothetical protein
MIDSLNPVGEFYVKLLQALRMVIRQLQGAFKTLLKGIKTAFHLTLGMGRELHLMRKMQNSIFG